MKTLCSFSKVFLLKRYSIVRHKTIPFLQVSTQQVQYANCTNKYKIDLLFTKQHILVHIHTYTHVTTHVSYTSISYVRVKCTVYMYVHVYTHT